MFYASKISTEYKGADLNFQLQDLKLEAVDLKEEVPHLRSGGIRLQFNLGLCSTLCVEQVAAEYVVQRVETATYS